MNICVKEKLKKLFPFIVVIVFFSPILFSGYLGDDMYNSLIYGSMLYTDTSLFERIIAESKGWIFGSGRLFIFNWIYIYSIFYFIQSVLIVKFICYTIVCANIVIFIEIIKNLFKFDVKNSKYLIAIIISYLLSVQFSKTHDPILAFAFIVPLVTLLNFLSILLIIKYKNNFIVYIISLLLFILALLTYELAYIFVPIIISIIYCIYKKNKPFFKIIPFLLIPLVLFLFIIYLKAFVIQTDEHPNGTYPDSNFNFNLRMIYAFLIQTAASVPFMQHLKVWLFVLIIPFIIFFKNFSLYNCIKIYKDNFLLKYLLGIGLLLLILPSLIISFSGHQHHLVIDGFGASYLSSYIQSFGFALIFFPIISQLLSKKNGVLLLVFLLTVNFILNARIVKSLNSSFKFSREIIVNASKEGIFNNFNNGTYVFRFMRQPSDYFWHYAQLTKKKIKTCEMANINQEEIDATYNYINCLTEIGTKPLIKNNKFIVYDLSKKIHMQHTTY